MKKNVRVIFANNMLLKSMIPIVFSTDHNYVMPTGVTIASLLKNSNGEIYDIYILAAKDVEKDDMELLTTQVNALSPQSRLSFISMGEKYDDAYETRGVSKATYYRLMIPWLIPHIDKIIYSDVDIIFKSSLKEIYNLDLQNNYLAVSQNNTTEGWIGNKRYFEKIGLDYMAYFNAGILVMNCELMRKDNLREKFEPLESQKYLYQDQDILNIVCKGRVVFFSNRFNLMPSLYGTKDDLYSNVVIHYAGEKPWKSFTCAWAEWWLVYNESLFRQNGYYSSISKKILNPKHQICNIINKIKTKLKMKIKNVL